MKAIALVFSFLMVGTASAQSHSICKLPLYIEAPHGTANSTSDSGKLFIYGLKTAIKMHEGCIVDKMQDAQLSLFVTTVKLVDTSEGSNSSIVSVALAVPLNGVPVYMDDYVLVIRDTDSVEGRVDALLESIGETLDKYNPEARGTAALQ